MLDDAAAPVAAAAAPAVAKLLARPLVLLPPPPPPLALLSAVGFLRDPLCDALGEAVLGGVAKRVRFGAAAAAAGAVPEEAASCFAVRLAQNSEKGGMLLLLATRGMDSI